MLRDPHAASQTNRAALLQAAQDLTLHPNHRAKLMGPFMHENFVLIGHDLLHQGRHAAAKGCLPRVALEGLGLIEYLHEAESPSTVHEPTQRARRSRRSRAYGPAEGAAGASVRASLRDGGNGTKERPGIHPVDAQGDRAHPHHEHGGRIALERVEADDLPARQRSPDAEEQFTRNKLAETALNMDIVVGNVTSRYATMLQQDSALLQKERNVLLKMLQQEKGDGEALSTKALCAAGERVIAAARARQRLESAHFWLHEVVLSVPHFMSGWSSSEGRALTVQLIAKHCARLPEWSDEFGSRLTPDTYVQARLVEEVFQVQQARARQAATTLAGLGSFVAEAGKRAGGAVKTAAVAAGSGLKKAVTTTRSGLAAVDSMGKGVADTFLGSHAGSAKSAWTATVYGSAAYVASSGLGALGAGMGWWDTDGAMSNLINEEVPKWLWCMVDHIGDTVTGNVGREIVNLFGSCGIGGIAVSYVKTVNAAVKDLITNPLCEGWNGSDSLLKCFPGKEGTQRHKDWIRAVTFRLNERFNKEFDTNYSPDEWLAAGILPYQWVGKEAIETAMNISLTTILGTAGVLVIAAGVTLASGGTLGPVALAGGLAALKGAAVASAAFSAGYVGYMVVKDMVNHDGNFYLQPKRPENEVLERLRARESEWNVTKKLRAGASLFNFTASEEERGKKEARDMLAALQDAVLIDNGERSYTFSTARFEQLLANLESVSAFDPDVQAKARSLRENFEKDRPGLEAAEVEKARLQAADADAVLESERVRRMSPQEKVRHYFALVQDWFSAWFAACGRLIGRLYEQIKKLLKVATDKAVHVASAGMEYAASGWKVVKDLAGKGVASFWNGTTGQHESIKDLANSSPTPEVLAAKLGLPAYALGSASQFTEAGVQSVMQQALEKIDPTAGPPDAMKWISGVVQAGVGAVGGPVAAAAAAAATAAVLYGLHKSGALQYLWDKIKWAGQVVYHGIKKAASTVGGAMKRVKGWIFGEKGKEGTKGAKGGKGGGGEGAKGNKQKKKKLDILCS